MSRPTPNQRIVITICPRECGEVDLPPEPGTPSQRLDAIRIADCLRALASARQLGDFVTVREGCAGGCGGPGPNVGVRMYSVPPPGRPPDHIAVGWNTYVHSLASIESVAAIIDENLYPPAFDGPPEGP